MSKQRDYNDPLRVIEERIANKRSSFEDSAEWSHAEIELLIATIDKLATFKAYVHKRLDDAGVPADPESTHKAEGCRIGGRLDVVFAECTALTAELSALARESVARSVALAKIEAEVIASRAIVRACEASSDAGWIPMSRELPPEGERVLVAFAETNATSGHVDFARRAGDCFDNANWHCAIGVAQLSHWRAALAPPADPIGKPTTMTPDEREAQRRSFAYGNANLANPDVTRAAIDTAAESMPTTEDA